MAAVTAPAYPAPAPAARAAAPAPNPRAIIALDVPTSAEAITLAGSLNGVASFYKIGLELFAAGEGRALTDKLISRGNKVFADLKLYDVPATVARATSRIAASGASFLTVHGDDSIMRAAVDNKGAHLKILAVTALTSLDDSDLHQLGYLGGVREFVLTRARQAQESGCDGVICSGREVSALRAQCGEGFLLVVPGIRPAPDITQIETVAEDDQKRTSTPQQVFTAGGDYVVIGRPVRDARDPAAALTALLST